MEGRNETRSQWLAAAVAGVVPAIVAANGLLYFAAVLIDQSLGAGYHPWVRSCHLLVGTFFVTAAVVLRRDEVGEHTVAAWLNGAPLLNAAIQAFYLWLQPVPQSLVPGCFIALTLGLCALSPGPLIAGLAAINVAAIWAALFSPFYDWNVALLAHLSTSVIAVAVWLLRNSAVDRLLEAQEASDLEKKAAEAALETLQAEQEVNRDLRRRMLESEKLESLGLLAGGIAHDFNNLLTPILANAELLAEQLPGDSLESEDCQDILQAALRARDLAEQLLAYAGRRNRPTTLVELGPALSEMTGLLRSTMPSGVVLTCSVAPDLHARIARTDLQQILSNLTLNAAEACVTSGADGRVDISVEGIRFDADLADQTIPPLDPGHDAWVRIRCRDDGEGIDPKIQRRIFDPFFTTKERGSGLGLATVLGCVQAAGGGLHAESAVGKGATFDVYLPRAHPEPRNATHELETPPVETTLQGRVLVVDDEAHCRDSAQRTLSHLGLRSIVCASGREAIEVLEREEVDLMILDLQMPDWDGERTHGEVRARRPALPILICSGFDRGQAARLLASDPATRHLAKPYRIQELGKALASLMAASHGSEVS